MSLQLKITDGTNTLVNLSDGTNCIISERDGGYQESPGSEVSVAPGDTAHDRVALLLKGGVSTITSTLTSIIRALADAERYEDDRVGIPIYLEGSKDSGSTWKRARIRSGDISYNVDEAIRSNAARATLEIDRVLGWDGAETQVPLTNLNGSNLTNGIRIYNCNDGSGTSPNRRCNYVDIAGSSILGDLPAPSRIRIVGPRWSERLFMGLTYKTDFANLVSYVEGEDFVATEPESDANCSGGEFAPILNYCTVSRLYARGSWFLPVARIRFDQADSALTIASGGLTNPSARTYYITRQSTGFDLYAFDPIRIPEAPYVSVDWGGNLETIYISCAEGADVDYIQFMPIDRWRILELVNGGSPTGIADDLIQEISYAQGTISPVVATGPGIYLEPGENQRVSFLTQNPTNAAAITETASVWMIYRPRYRAL
jgi:hypothetical protein